MPESDRSRQRAGVLYAVAAFGTWGVIPIYYKAVAEVPALEVLGHRIVWSVVLLAALLWLRRGWPEVRNAFRNRRALLMLAASGVLVSINWLTFIYAISTDRVVDCSLGYFINPLVSVLLGTLLLRERLRPAQIGALMLATGAVVVMTIAHGSLPWIALLLPATFSLYALLRKTVAVEALAGLGMETMLLTPIALVYLIGLERHGTAHFGYDWALSVLLACAGFVTALPLLWFVNAARRLPLTTVGLLQYIAPTGHLLLGVLVYGESLTPVRAASFVVVWIALALFSWDGIRAYRARNPAQLPARR